MRITIKEAAEFIFRYGNVGRTVEELLAVKPLSVQLDRAAQSCLERFHDDSVIIQEAFDVLCEHHDVPKIMVPSRRMVMTETRSPWQIRFELLATALKENNKDGHMFGSRPCQSCAAISLALAEPYGCNLFRLERKNAVH